MKRKLTALTTALMITAALFCGCGSSSESGGSSSEPIINAVDVDLTQLSSTMVYSEVNNMMSSPESYSGKTVRAKGQFSYYQDESTGNEYFAVLIADATACCSQGIEFVLGSGGKYPEDYPELGEEITVTGKFNSYEENGYTYCQLTGAEISA